GALLTPARAIVIVAPPGSEHEAALRLGRIGFDNVRGHLAGGIDAARSRPEVVRRGRRVTSAELASELRRGTLTLIDVRLPGEWAQGALPGATHIPLDQLEERLAEIPRGGRIAVYCQSGLRSSTAASLLEQAGFGDVLDLIGGY